MSEVTLGTIEAKAKAYADRRGMLRDCLQQVERELAAIKKRHMKELKRHIALTADCETALRAAIQSAPDLFARPKTQILHGIKVGFRKGPGGLDWEDDDDLVRRIEKLFPDDDEAERYLIVKKKPSAEALEDLDAAQLKRLGVAVIDVGDEVVIKPVETDIEKLVKALLKGAIDEADE
jgi:hypothetical protein